VSICSECGSTLGRYGRCPGCQPRLCSGCRLPLPTDRKSWRCRLCDREHCRRRKEADPERYRGHGRRWWEANRDAISERNRDSYAANREEECRRKREAYAANLERERQRSRDYTRANRVKDKERKHRRRARKLGCVVTEADFREVAEKSGGLCSICRAYVPEGLRHIDHIIPLDKGGAHSPENLQMLCYRCNTSKGAKLPDEVVVNPWVKVARPDQPFLLNPDWR
jgi:5-methylcytosine-specific restriction endonuclease McrA